MELSDDEMSEFEEEEKEEAKETHELVDIVDDQENTPPIISPNKKTSTTFDPPKRTHRNGNPQPYVMPTLPPAYRDQILRNVSLIDRLVVNTEWKWATVVDDITLSVCSATTYPVFIKASCTIAHHPRAIWEKVWNLCNTNLYPSFIEDCAVTEVMNAQATKYSLKLHGGKSSLGHHPQLKLIQCFIRS